ncbi:MAG TPA: DUF2905 domain-containing protein [Bacillota bacterium]
MGGLGRFLILFGIVLAGFGLVLLLMGQFNLGRLPGDIVWRRGNFTLFFPLATSLLLSLLLTLILNLVLRR